MMENVEKISQAEIYRFIAECEANEKIRLTHFALVQGDAVSARFCKKPYRWNDRQLLFSMTKSFASLAVGIAVDQGILRLDDLVASFFPEELPLNPHPNLWKMQVRHLLSMTAGIHENTYAALFPQPDWIKAFLAQDFPHAPGTYYRYSTHATHMLSAIIQKTSGKNLARFLEEHLFSAMGIRHAQWERSPEGLTAGGMGLSLRTSDLIRIARMLLRRGVYDGKRIVSEEYLRLATSPQATKQDDAGRPDRYFSGCRYGFQFHIQPNGMYRADGAFGQFCVVCPDRDFAVVATSQKTETESFLALIDKHFVRAAAYPDPVPQRQRKAYLSALSYAAPRQDGRACDLPQCAFKLERNALDISRVEFLERRLRITYRGGVRDDMEMDFGGPVYGRSHFVKDLETHMQAHCAFATRTDDGGLLLTVYYIETPYVASYRFRFMEDRVTLSFHVNVSLTLEDFIVCGIRDASPTA